ncbi:hypothetical protein ABPG75_007369 [Micractinium tetrahymenae]
MQLPEQISTLLPPTTSGEPALPLSSLSTQRRVLLANLMFYKAMAVKVSGERPLVGFVHFKKADALLAASSTACEQSLQLLAALQRSLLPGADAVPTLAQLRCFCNTMMVEAIGEGGVVAAVPADVLQRMQPAFEQAAAEALQLEPGSPKLHWKLGRALMAEQSQRALHQFLRCCELAQQQGSDFFTAAGATFALWSVSRDLPNAGSAGRQSPVSLASAEGALAVFPKAEPAFRRCKRLLPQTWLADLKDLLPMAEVAFSAVQTRLQLRQLQLQAQRRPAAGSRASAAARQQAQSLLLQLEEAESALDDAIAGMIEAGPEPRLPGGSLASALRSVPPNLMKSPS